MSTAAKDKLANHFTISIIKLRPSQAIQEITFASGKNKKLEITAKKPKSIINGIIQRIKIFTIGATIDNLPN